MSRKTIYLLIIIAVISLSGIIITQIYWVGKAYGLQEKQFNDRVVIALSSVVDRIQEANHDSAFVEPVSQVSPSYYVANINDTLHPYFLETLLKEEFTSLNLEEDFEYAIYDCFSDSIVYGARINMGEDTERAPALNLGNQKRFNNDGHYFGIYFPKKTTVLIRQMDFWIFSSVAIIVVIFFFAYAITIILRQKRLSEVKTDFINNMTHELKTPISTIAISSEMLLRNDVQSDEERMMQYASIIKNENQRLQSQVERVLSVATLSPDKLKLNKEIVDMHEIIQQATESQQLHLHDREGALILNIDATDSMVEGDRVHLTNLVYNLIDNAVKYTEAQPQITISSGNEKGFIVMEVKDNGIGIDQKHQRMIFDKFFRVPTGNVHNVKGFGLGLFYVHTVVEAHDGQVIVESEPGQGSRFIVKLKSTTS
ncbi:MAG: HAMP domain-containing histidine kinase [Flavobacteriales bacterium]|nr:HAMP domain-containing histidine kinase [Flavobacteriales bacterium]